LSCVTHSELEDYRAHFAAAAVAAGRLSSSSLLLLLLLHFACFAGLLF